MALRTSARFGLARLGAMRLGSFEAVMKVLINGTDRTNHARIEGCTITHLLNHEPDTCSLRVASSSGIILDAPVSAPTVTSYTGTGLTVGSDYKWKVSFVTPDGETAAGPESSAHTVPAALVLSAPTSTNLSNARNYTSLSGPTSGGTYSYKATWFHTITGIESEAGPATNSFVSDGNAGIVDADAVTGKPSWANCLRIYRTAADGATWHLFPWSSGPYMTAFGAASYIDSATDAELTDQPPVSPSGDRAAVSLTGILASSGSGVTARKIYRTEADGSTFKFLATIADATTTTYVDSMADGSLGSDEPLTTGTATATYTPVKGHELKIYCGDTDLTHQLFGGHILNVESTYEAIADAVHLVYDLNAVDYTWLLNRRKVIKKYTNTSATTIIADLISSYASGFTTTHLTSGLDVIDEITFTNEDLTDAISRVAERIGAYWYVDYAKDVHFFLSEGSAANSITDANPRGARAMVESEDLSQVATRVECRGGGVSAAVEVAAGSTTIPVDDTSWYSASGGTVECGPQRITYAGVQAGGTGSTVPQTAASGSTVPQRALGAPSTNLSNTHIFGVAMPAGWSGYWCFTFYDADGETTKSPLAGLYTNVTGGTADGSLSSIDTGSSGTVGRRIYRTKTGGVPSGPFFRVGQIANNSSTTFADNVTDANLGTESPPSTNSTGLAPVAAGSTSLPVAELSVFTASGWLKVGSQLVSYSGRSGSSGSGTLTGIPASGVGSLASAVAVGTAVYNTSYVLAGATSLPVAELSVFPSGGGWVSAGNQLIRFTGRSGSSGSGTLTGIPSSGIGAIAVAIVAGTEVLNAPHLTGVSGILYAINKGDQVNVLETANDTTAQAAMAGFVGGDGIHVEFISDGRLSSTEALARAQAELSLSKNPLVTVTYQTRDPSHNVGYDVTIARTYPPVSGTFRIQSVTFSEIGITGGLAKLLPLRTVTASTRRFSFADILKRFRSAA